MGKTWRVSGSFGQDNVRVQGPGVISCDVFGVTGDGWHIHLSVEFIVDAADAISAALGGLDQRSWRGLFFPQREPAVSAENETRRAAKFL